MRRVLFATAALALVTTSWGHLLAGTLKLSRTGPYHPGDTLTVSFGVDIPHPGGCNVDLSLDGKTWKTIKASIPAKTKQTYFYKWTVGADTSSHGRLRICQMNGKQCTDADSTDDPKGSTVAGSRYFLISSPFAITAKSIVPSQIEFNAGSSRSFRQIGPGALDLAFSLTSDGLVSLIAYNAQGRKTAVLFRDRFTTGSHRISLFSEALRTHPEWVLRLDAAGRSETLKP
jgi:hypothetical protein